jgi:hypothetical protein
MNLYVQAQAVAPAALSGKLTPLAIAVSVARAEGPMNSLTNSARYAVELVRGPDALFVPGLGSKLLAAPPTEFSIAVEKHGIDGVYVLTATPVAPTAATVWMPGSYVLALHAAIKDVKGTSLSGSTLLALEIP